MKNLISKIKENIKFLFVVDDTDNDITAVCPDTNLCYAHMGQHSTYSPGWVKSCCRIAEPKEYKPLLNELENIIGYNVDVLNERFSIDDLF